MTRDHHRGDEGGLEMGGGSVDPGVSGDGSAQYDDSAPAPGARRASCSPERLEHKRVSERAISLRQTSDTN